jgi:hypothetical protein
MVHEPQDDYYLDEDEELEYMRRRDEEQGEYEHESKKRT